MSEALSIADYRRLRGSTKKARRNKYNAMRTVVDGLRFDSKREANAWCELKRRERAGEIRNLERQVKYPLFAATPDGYFLEPCCIYVADFRFFDVKRKETVVADAKGVLTAMFRLKQKMMRICHGIDVVLV